MDRITRRMERAERIAARQARRNGSTRRQTTRRAIIAAHLAEV